jgi:hypothetical protein
VSEEKKKKRNRKKGSKIKISPHPLPYNLPSFTTGLKGLPEVTFHSFSGPLFILRKVYLSHIKSVLKYLQEPHLRDH